MNTINQAKSNSNIPIDNQTLERHDKDKDCWDLMDNLMDDLDEDDPYYDYYYKWLAGGRY